VFGRDTIHNIAFKANWDQIQKRKQDMIIKSNRNENKSQIPYEYKVGDQVLLETPGILQKLSTPCTGPQTLIPGVKGPCPTNLNDLFSSLTQYGNSL
jgi:hypothetical protein